MLAWVPRTVVCAVSPQFAYLEVCTMVLVLVGIGILTNACLAEEPLLTMSTSVLIGCKSYSN